MYIQKRFILIFRRASIEFSEFSLPERFRIPSFTDSFWLTEADLFFWPERGSSKGSFFVSLPFIEQEVCLQEVCLQEVCLQVHSKRLRVIAFSFSLFSRPVALHAISCF
jgi:hypothetical protein